MRPITLIIIVALFLGAGWYLNIGNIQGLSAASLADNTQDTDTYVHGCTASSCKAYEYCDKDGDCKLLSGRCYTGADCISGQCTDFHYCTCTSNAQCNTASGFNCNIEKGYCTQAVSTPS